MQNKKYVSVIALATIGIGLAMAASAFADTTTVQGYARGMMGRGNAQGRGIVGTVTAVNGSTITITSKFGGQGKNDSETGSTASTTTTYTVNASSATVTKAGVASTVSAIAVGDTVVVQGTVSGTTVTATTIRDGVIMGGGKGANGIEQPIIQGNGQPVVAGAVTAISGNTITITNKSNVTYTVDATNAKFVVGGVTSPTISNVAVGDNLTVQGAVNGTSVTASSVIDQKAKANDNSGNNPAPQDGFMGGMMRGIGNFFKHVFGF